MTTMLPALSTETARHEDLMERHSAHNYHPLPVVVAEAQGAWVTDVEGRRYLDCLAGYSALNFGHRHPALIAAAHAQLDRVTLTSRAFGNDRIGPFCAALAGLLGTDPVPDYPTTDYPTTDYPTTDYPTKDYMVLVMNTGAEAVESGIKVARKWGYEKRGVPHDRARIVVMAGGFHGRTTTIVGFSTDPDARGGFGPFTPGFDVVPYGDADALRAAMTPDTVAVLLEPVQGEAGVVVPPPGYLAAVRRICDDAGALMIADEVQSGLGRTGHLLATRSAGVDADVYLLGKALGGGIVPLSAVVADESVLGVLRPGQHGSTFGGNPLACAVGSAVVDLLADPAVLAHARTLGGVLAARLDELVGHGVVAVRTAGPWAGIDVDPRLGSGRDVCAALARRGVLAKDTHGATLRLSPPLIATPDEIELAVDVLAAALTDLR